MRRWVERAAIGLWLVVAMLSGGASPAFAATASLSIQVSPNPTQGVPGTITLSGADQNSAFLWAWVGPGLTGCADNAGDEATAVGADEQVTELAGGAPISPGSFSNPYSYTPMALSASVLVCAYLEGSNEYATPDAANSATFTPASPSASITVQPSANPSAGVPVTLATSGTSELEGALYVWVGPGLAGCADNAADEATAVGADEQVTELASDASVGPGSYSTNLNYTPSLLGNYEVCGYVQASNPNSAPYAALSQSFTAVVPPASVAISVPTTSEIDGEVAITATGQTLLPETLELTAANGTSQPAPIGSSSGSVGPGAYSTTVMFKPTEFGTYSIEAQVIDPQKIEFVNGFPVSPVSGSASASIAVPSATPSQPKDAVTAPELNPVFTWQGLPGEQFALDIWENGRGIIQIQTKGYSDPPPHPAVLLTRGLEPLTRVADFSVTPTGAGSAHLTLPLPPGTYRWSVLTAPPAGDPAAVALSTPRTFTVLGPRLRFLAAHAVAHFGPSYKYPGYTILTIRATPYSDVELKVGRGAHAASVKQYLRGVGRATLRINWSCTRAAGDIRYSATAHDDEGDQKAVHGVMDTVSAAQCHALLVAQQQAQALAQKRAEQQAQRQQAAAYQRFIFNCEQLGGTPVTLLVASGTETVCRGPYGGILYVPY